MGKTRKSQTLVQSQAPAHFNDHELKIISQTPAAFGDIESMDTSFHKDASSDSSSDSAFTEPKTLYVRLLSNTSDRAFYENKFSTLSTADKKLLKSIVAELDAHHTPSQENQRQLNRLMHHLGFELLSPSVDQQGLYEVPVPGATYAVSTDSTFYEIPISGEDNNYEEIPGITGNLTHIVAKPKKPALPIYDTAEPSKGKGKPNQPLYDQADPLLKGTLPTPREITSLYDRADPAPKTQTNTAGLYDLAESMPIGGKAQNIPTYDLASSSSTAHLLPGVTHTEPHDAEYGFQESFSPKTNTLSSGNYELEIPNHSEQGALPSEFYDNIAGLDYASVSKKEAKKITLAGSADESDDFGFDEDKNGYIQMAPDSTDDQAIYTAADNSKPTRVAPLLPARPSLLKKHDNKVDHPAPASSLLAADTTLEPQQQVLIESILNLIRTYEPIEENSKKSKNKVVPVVYLAQKNDPASADTPVLIPITDEPTDKKNPPTPQQGFFRRNRHVIIPATILLAGTIVFVAYWFTRNSSSEDNTSHTEESAATTTAELFSTMLQSTTKATTKALTKMTTTASPSASTIAQTSQNIATTMSTIFDAATTTASNTLSAITTTTSSLVDAISSTTTTLTDAATTTSSTIADAISSTTTTLVDATTTMSSTIANAISSTTTTLADAASTTSSTIADAIRSTTTTLTDAATTASSTIADAISSTTTTLTNAATTTTSSIANAISSTTTTLADAATTTTSSIANAISSTTTTLIDAATTTTSSIANAISSTTTTLADAATTTTSSIANAISSTTSTLANAISTTTSTIADVVSSTTSTIAKTTATFFQAPTTTTTTTHLTTTPGCLFSTCSAARTYTLSGHSGAPEACACAAPVISNCPKQFLFGC